MMSSVKMSLMNKQILLRMRKVVLVWLIVGFFVFVEWVRFNNDSCISRFEICQLLKVW